MDSAALTTGQDGRQMLNGNGRQRVALPMAYVESCVSKVESDFLWRFFEAWDFDNGNTTLFNSDGEALGRYGDHAAAIGPEAYIKLELQAYRWVKQYGLGREWALIAEAYLQMMADKAKMTFLDWGSILTNSDNEHISLGGAQVSVKMLGIRLKDAYRDFFRWYSYVKDCDANGREPTAHGALGALEREQQVRQSINQFKVQRGLVGTETG